MDVWDKGVEYMGCITVSIIIICVIDCVVVNTIGIKSV